MPNDDLSRLSFYQYTRRWAVAGAVGGSALGSTAVTTTMAAVPPAVSIATSFIVSPVVEVLGGSLSRRVGGTLAPLATSMAGRVVTEGVRTGAYVVTAAAQETGRWSGWAIGGAVGAMGAAAAGAVTYPIYSYIYRPIRMGLIFDQIRHNLDNQASAGDFIEYLRTRSDLSDLITHPEHLLVLKEFAEAPMNASSHQQPAPEDFQGTLAQVLALSQTLKMAYLNHRSQPRPSVG